jgi:hypothetical protein
MYLYTLNKEPHISHLSRGLTRGIYILCIEHLRMLRLSRESNQVPPALQANTLCKEPFGISACAATSPSVFRECGFVASSSADWALDLATYPMSVMIACGGLSAAIFGKWTIKVGPLKKSGLRIPIHI